MSMINKVTSQRQAGLSLIELAVSLTLGLLVTLALSGVYLANRGHYHQAERFARMQDAGRFAMDLLVRDLSLADFWGGFSEPSNDPGSTVIPLTGDCGPADISRWAFNVNNAIEYFMPASVSDLPSAHFQCVPNSSAYSYRPGSNVLAVKHVTGSCVSRRKNKDGNYVCPDQAGQAGHVYVRVNGDSASWVLSDGSAPPETADPTESPVEWEYVSHIYYVATDDNSGIPSLRRKHLTQNGGIPAIEDAGELAEGVEFFHIQFGVDDVDLTNAVCDEDTYLDRYVGISDTFKSATHTLRCALSARIYVLVRSLEPDPSLPADDKTYLLGGINVSQVLTGNATFNDHFQRRVYVTTVQLRNRVYQNAVKRALPK